MDGETTTEYSESILEEAAKNDIESTNMHGTSKVHHQIDAEDFGEEKEEFEFLNSRV